MNQMWPQSKFRLALKQTIRDWLVYPKELPSSEVNHGPRQLSKLTSAAVEDNLWIKGLQTLKLCSPQTLGEKTTSSGTTQIALLILPSHFGFLMITMRKDRGQQQTQSCCSRLGFSLVRLRSRIMVNLLNSYWICNQHGYTITMCALNLFTFKAMFPCKWPSSS